uniref:Uncharacterized protein n=1 Tax=Knipowitschia caucasica TaxID=637954 RepID=A0AAV2KL26_KNICA
MCLQHLCDSKVLCAQMCLQHLCDSKVLCAQMCLQHLCVSKVLCAQMCLQLLCNEDIREELWTEEQRSLLDVFIQDPSISSLSVSLDSEQELHVAFSGTSEV